MMASMVTLLLMMYPCLSELVGLMTHISVVLNTHFYVAGIRYVLKTTLVILNEMLEPHLSHHITRNCCFSIV